MQAAVDLLCTERLVELTQTLVAIPSETGHEHAIGDWLAHFLDSLGLSVQRLPVEDAGDTIVGTLPAASASSDGPTMMLNFHLDTFDAFENWETDPFEPRLSADGRRIVGLGAHDMKAGAACVLGAVEAIVQSSAALGGTLLVVGTTDEEYWSRGAHALVASGLIDRCSYNIVPEPVRQPASALLLSNCGAHPGTVGQHWSQVSQCRNRIDLGRSDRPPDLNAHSALHTGATRSDLHWGARPACFQASVPRRVRLGGI